MLPQDPLPLDVSRPSRARGLKQATLYLVEQRGTVAPLTGAWIETLIPTESRWWCIVAPLTGAWIETSYDAQRRAALSVAPLTGAWIETTIVEKVAMLEQVAPLTGAWIET